MSSVFTQTRSGNAFYPFNPFRSEFSIEDIAEPLAKLPRFNGHTDGVFYSVAEHSVHVSRLVKRKGGDARAQLIALLHDAHEAFIGDIPAPLKKCMYFGDPKDDEILGASELCARIQRAIQSDLVPGLLDGIETKEERELWQHADRVALVTEARDLLGNPPVNDWANRGFSEYVPDVCEVVPLGSWRDSKALFLTVYHRLLKEIENHG